MNNHTVLVQVQAACTHGARHHNHLKLPTLLITPIPGLLYQDGSPHQFILKGEQMSPTLWLSQLVRRWLVDRKLQKTEGISTMGSRLYHSLV